MSEECYVEAKWGRPVLGEPTKREREVVDRAVAAAAFETGIQPCQIVGRTRVESVAQARFIVYDICFKTNVFSQSQLGRCFGRDHGTIYHGVRVVKQRLDEKENAFKKFRELYARIKRKYKEYENNPERMVQELSVHDG